MTKMTMTKTEVQASLCTNLVVADTAIKALKEAGFAGNHIHYAIAECMRSKEIPRHNDMTSYDYGLAIAEHILAKMDEEYNQTEGESDESGTDVER